MKLTKKQTKALDLLEDNHTQEVIFGGGAGGAKSILGCYWILKSAIKYPNTRWLIGRSKLKTLKETTLNSFWEVCRMQGIGVELYNYNSQSHSIKLFNGSEIMLKDLFAYPSDPNFDSLGSLEITGAFVDECNQIKHKAWEVLKSRIRYRIDENNLIPKILGTCNPSKNWVYADYYKPEKNGTIEPYRAFIQALATDNPYISKHYIESLRRITNRATKERLLNGNWEYDDNPAALIDIDSMHDYFNNQHVKGGDGYITADIARMGDDLTVIRVWSGFRVLHREVIEKSGIDSCVLTIRQLANRFEIPMSRVLVDEDGVGGGVKDILKCKGFVANSRAVKVKGREENYINMKAQCTYRMAERICNKELYEPCDNPEIRQKIIEEFEQVCADRIDKDSKLYVLPKDKVKDAIGRSPDDWDCIMMREYFEIVKKKITVAVSTN